MAAWLDPHIHMISRVTDDYHRLAQCDCVALSEPAFWAGFDRGSAGASALTSAPSSRPSPSAP